jgi:hypothetical protein
MEINRMVIPEHPGGAARAAENIPDLVTMTHLL